MSAPGAANVAARKAQANAALRILQNKKPVPEIDFTIHTMDDGTTASTLERYSKG
ncbi:3',5'-cyclic-nucleotide phosphodiesterase (PDEase) (3':5'-CNP), partial [Podila horticola]